MTQDYSQHASGEGKTGGVAQSQGGSAAAGESAVADRGGSAVAGESSALAGRGGAAAAGGGAASVGAVEKFKRSRWAKWWTAICLIVTIATVALFATKHVDIGIAGLVLAVVSVVLAAVPIIKGD